MSDLNKNKGYPLRWYHRLLLWVLSQGVIPNHVAVILDGNRRWARQRGKQISEGHMEGGQIARWMLRGLHYVGVKQVTLYVLSTHNIASRSKQELDNLYEQFRRHCTAAINEESKTVRYRFIGDLALLPKDLQQLACRLEHQTRNNTAFTVNYAIAYGSRHNFTRMVNCIQDACGEGVCKKSDVDDKLLSDCLSVWECPPVDLLLRTSGERRLSDFMLWQCAYSVNAFQQQPLGDTNIIHLAAALIHYQLQQPFVNYFRARSSKTSEEYSTTPSDHPLVSHLDNVRWKFIKDNVEGAAVGGGILG